MPNASTKQADISGTPTGEQVGLMFGSFNPPHLAHVKTAEKLKQAGGLKEVWLLPVPASPFKKGTLQATFKEKVEMCSILAAPHQTWLKTSEACANFPSGLVRQLQEYKRTIEKLFAENEGVQFKLIAGEDFVRRFDQAIAALEFFTKLGETVQQKSPVQIKLVNEFTRRVGHAHDVLSNIDVLATERSKLLIPANDTAPVADADEISSSNIRRAIMAGQEMIAGLTPELRDFINRRKIYDGLRSDMH